MELVYATLFGGNKTQFFLNTLHIVWVYLKGFRTAGITSDTFLEIEELINGDSISRSKTIRHPSACGHPEDVRVMGFAPWHKRKDDSLITNIKGMLLWITREMMGSGVKIDFTYIPEGKLALLLGFLPEYETRHLKKMLAFNVRTATMVVEYVVKRNYICYNKAVHIKGRGRLKRSSASISMNWPCW